MRVHVATLALFASPTLAAYVQWQYCNGYNGNTEFVPEGLRAYLQLRDSRTQVALDLIGRTPRHGCDSLSSDLNATIDITLLGGSITSSVAADTTCSALSRPHGDNESAILKAALSTDTDILYPVSTFHLDIHLSRGKLTDEVGCVSADITPEFTPMVKMTLQLLPAITLLAVLLAGCVRTLVDKPDITTEEHPGPQQLGRQSILPGASDCLYHLQFVFLTGALSLRYPGFYQPVVSHLNWFSLLSSSNALTNGVTYPSVNDGIYEINGTYGGTYGLELMTQIVGAPMTMDLWVNMVILIAFISIGLVLLLEVTWFLNRNQQAHHQLEEQEQQPRTGFRRLISQVLSLVLSYFLLPLVTLSAYQIDHAGIFPAYHTSLAVGLIVTIVLGFLWLLQQIPVRNLGVLILDRSKAYQPVPGASRRDDSFVLSFFVLTFIRALAIGGLQIAPIAQITVLILSEIVCIVCIVAFHPDSILSTGTICAASRLATLLFMIAFLPGVAGLSVKSVIGYILLFQQAIVLLLVILLPNIYRLIQLCLSARRGETPPVYDAYELSRRQRRDTADYEQSIDRISYSNDTEGAFNTASISISSGDVPRGLEADTLSVSSSSRYYRPPRSSSRNTFRPGVGLMSAVSTRSSRPYSLSDASGEVSRGSTTTPELDLAALSSSSRSTSPDLSDATSTTVEMPLGPRWGDYSFREVDLAYGRSPQQSPDRVPTVPETRPQKRQVSSSRSLFSAFPAVLGRSGPKKKGFEVVRGRNPSR
ncbi:hypothetical protein F4859DRAFT_494293 [Xylaria cf. heliscus]|nr:hypothetical protein F4859DRAFT_494293 [Xylaria cf. heliscus]